MHIQCVLQINHNYEAHGVENTCMSMYIFKGMLSQIDYTGKITCGCTKLSKEPNSKSRSVHYEKAKANENLVWPLHTYILLVKFVNIPADDSITQKHTLNKKFSRFISQLTSRDMVYKDPFLFLAIKHT